MSRRTTWLLILLVFIAGDAAADGSVGFFAGLNNGNLSGDTPPNTTYEGRTGLILGAMGEIRIAKDVMLGIHPMYIQKGSTVTVQPLTADGTPLENELSLDYFSVPVLVKIESGNGVTYVSGGFDIAFLMDANLNTSSGDIDASEIMQDFDLSMDFAFGAKIPVGGPVVTLEARYSQSLLNVADLQVGDEDYSFPARFRSSGFQLLAGLLFPLGAR